MKFHIVSIGNINNGFRRSLCDCVCVTIDATLNFVVNANVKCEHSLVLSNIVSTVSPSWGTAPPGHSQNQL